MAQVSDPEVALPSFPSVEVSSVSDSVAEEAKALLETELPEVKLEVVQTRGARALMAGHGKQLQAMIAEMAKRLGVANDPRDVTVSFNADPHVNASVITDPKTKKVLIKLNAGLLAFVKNQDELATILAHEMSHANKDLFRFKGDPPRIKDLLKSIPTSSNPRQTEELRADIGAIHRMIGGGYNPWGGYEFFKRFAKHDAAVKDGDASAKNIRPVFSFLSTHPASELRMSVMKSYITARQQKENLLSVTSKFNEFTPSLKALTWRMSAYSAIATANKSAIALKGTIAAAATIGVQIGTALMISHDTSAQLGMLISPGNEIVGGISSIIEYLWFGPPPEVYSDAISAAESVASKNAALTSISEIIDFGKSLRHMPAEKAAQLIAGISGTGAAAKWTISKLRLNAKERALDAGYTEIVSQNAKLRHTRQAIKRTPQIVKLHRELMQAGEFDRAGTLLRALKTNLNAQNESDNFWNFEFKRKNPGFTEREFNAYFRKRTKEEFVQRQILLNQLVEEYLPRLSMTKVREIVKVIESQSSEDLLRPELVGSYGRMLESFKRQNPQIAFSTKVNRVLAAHRNALDSSPGTDGNGMAAILRRTNELLTGRHIIYDRPKVKASTQPSQAIKFMSTSPVSAEGIQSLIGDNLGLWLDEIEMPGERGETAKNLFRQAYNDAVAEVERTKDTKAAIKFQMDVLEKIKSRWTRTENPRLLFLPNSLSVRTYGDSKAKKQFAKLAESMNPGPRFWKLFDNVNSVVELDELVTSRFINGLGLSVDAEPLNSLYLLLESRPNLIAGQRDLDRLLEKEYFWNRMGTGSPILDGDILNSMQSKVGSKTGSDLWIYRPQASEKLHKLILDRMKDFGSEPKTRSESLKLWQQFVGRGVTATSDRMFAELYDSGTAADRKKLREVSKGRIWEPQLRSRVLIDKISEMPEYKSLVRTADELKPSRPTQAGRLAGLREVIRAAEIEFEGRGPEYDAVIESVLKNIKSSQVETRYAARYRGTLGKGQADVTMRTLSALTERVRLMTAAEKWEYILWLRGEKPASKNIEQLFPVVGADRVSRMYSLLPDYQKALVIDNVLDSRNGLLPTANINSKWGKVIVDHLIGSGKGNDVEAEKARQVARDVLEAYLDSFDGPGANKAQRTLVLSYMLASKTGDGSNGRVLKQVLEAMGASGVKIGQFIVAADILGEESDNQILRTLQDQANIPQRSRIYQDLVNASSGAPLPGKIDDLLGAASVKYAVKAFDVEDGSPFVLKVLREEASATIEQQFARLRAMSDSLTKKHKGKYSVLRSIVRASEEAVNRELKLGNEVRNSADATKMIYEKLDDFTVPKEFLVDETVIRSEFASGVSIHDLTIEKRGEAAQRIIDVEGANLFSDQDVITFDPDRHPGNFKLELEESTGRLRVKPIDFGQVITITRVERQNVIDLFAQAAILDKTGSTKWSAEQIGRQLGLPKEKISKLKTSLSSGFPAKNRSALASYYTLLAALEDIGHPQPIQYFDFARAVVQHNQYISMVEDSLVAKGKTIEEAKALVRAPRDELTDRVKKSISDQMGDGAPYGTTDKMRIVWNQGTKKVEEFVAEKTRKSRAEVGRAVTSIREAPAECAAWFAKLVK